MNKVSPVRDQGSCGSCWAFAAVAAIESSQRIRMNKKYDLSEQQLTSCTYLDKDGCDGGWMINAYKYLLNS